MRLETDDFSDLEQRYSMYIIQFVGDYPGCIKAEITPEGDPRRVTKLSRIEFLVDSGYIEYIIINDKKTKRLQLTEKGRNVYEHVKAIHGILKTI